MTTLLSLMTEEEVADLLRISRRRLQEWMRAHPDAPHVPIGRVRRFAPDDVQRIIAMMREEARTPIARHGRTAQRPASRPRRQRHPQDAVAEALAMAGGQRVVSLAQSRQRR